MITYSKVSEAFPNSSVIRYLVEQATFTAWVVSTAIRPEINVANWVRKTGTLNTTVEKLSCIRMNDRDKICVRMTQTNFFWSIFEVRLRRIESVDNR